MKHTEPVKKSVKPSKKARELAYDVIENLILTSQIDPGEFVTETSLSKQLKIGRTPVREALKKLEEKGLIITNNGRKRVYILSIHEIEEIFDLKICIEGGMARWAAIRGKEEDFKMLQKMMKEIKGFMSRRPAHADEEGEWLKEWLGIDRRLHALIFQMADNTKSENIIRNLNTQWHRLKIGIHTMEGRIEKSVVEHEKFAQAIINRDPSMAEESMKDHLENLRRELVKLLKLFNYPTL